MINHSGSGCTSGSRLQSEMRLRTALGLLVCFVYLNQAIHGADTKVTYSKSGATDGKFLVKTVNPDDVAATTINPNDVATIATNPEDVAAVKSLYMSTNGQIGESKQVG